MFCIKCGTKLSDEARFCHMCGASVAEMTAPSRPADNRGCSERQGDLVLVKDGEDDILYFIRGGVLYAHDTAAGETYIVYRPAGGYVDNAVAGLNCSDGVITFIEEKRLAPEKKFSLMRIAVTGKTAPVDERPIDLARGDGLCIGDSGEGNFTRFIMHNGKYMFRCGGDIVALDPDTMEITEKTLPGVERAGTRYDGFQVSGDYGYVFIAGHPETSVRFPLEEPGRTQVLSTDCCSPQERDFLTFTQGRLLSHSRDGRWFVTDVSGETAGEPVRMFSGLELDKTGGDDWFCVGGVCFVRDIAIEPDAMDVRRLPFDMGALHISDFVPDGAGGAYVMNPRGLYHLPKEFPAGLEKAEDMEKYLTAGF